SLIFGIVSDISERKTIEIELLKAKEKAEHSDMTKSQFLANMSHEIRTPMNAVIGFANLLLKTRLSEEQSEYLKIIEASSQNLLAIINDILDISKIQAGKFRLAHTEFNINEIVENTAKKLNVLADNKGLAINIFAEPIAPRLIGDPVRLEQVLTNLLSNAIKFTKAGSINVNLSKISETENSIQINISVQDTGIGIACDKLDKIFEYFEQLDTRDKKNYAGSGLGLGISKKMIEMMGGLIKVSSEEGHGSVFQFAINFSKAVVKKEHAFSRNVSKTPADHLSSAENQVKVLIAEDEFVNQRLIASLIQLRGWECRIAGNGLETLRMLGQEHFDIVLMDIQMPEMDGFETTHAIREMEKITGKKVIIIAVTAFAMRSDYERCMEAGMDDYISKPLQIDGFFDKLDTILARRGVQNTLITV
ncbi:MAG TPA: ATP-binding protein, partial [Candidatus Wallbacteria bacterium]|nr:ATP-binding protein [Candidatus Wallbacteria bacterium]